MPKEIPRGSHLGHVPQPKPPPYVVRDKRGPFSKGNHSQNKSLSRMEIGRTPFGCPRWEMPPPEPNEEQKKLIKHLDKVLARPRHGPPSPLRRYRKPASEPQLVPRWCRPLIPDPRHAIPVD